MSSWRRRSVWFSRFVLGGATLMMARLGTGNVLDPIGDASKRNMTLTSPDAITVMRVQGGLVVGFAAILAFCVVSERRLLAGLGVLATISAAIAGTRVLGLALDGPGTFTLMVVKPEVILAVLSTLALFLEWRRSRAGARQL
ncbi:MAG TPA: DUF4345 family protein [Gemmatimonadales bacterium]|nr:DUF4345 family protein [Gemmatimonadales bacterium]